MQVKGTGQDGHRISGKTRRWITRAALGAGAVLAIFLFWDLITFLLLPLITALILTYLGLPLVRRLEKKLNRKIAILCYFALIIAAFAVILLAVGPTALVEWSSFSTELPNLKNSLAKVINGIAGSSRLPDFIIQIPEKISETIQAAISGILPDLGNTFRTISGVFIGLLFLFLILNDREYIGNSVLFLLPSTMRTSAIAVLARIRKEIDKYLKGQLIMAMISGLITMIGFHAVGLRFAFLLGTLATIFGFIPLIGPLLGAVPALLVGLVQGTMVFLYCIIVIAIQQIVLGIAGPSVFARSLSVHPLYAFITLAAGGFLGGILGFMLAVPVLIIIKSTASEVFGIYLKRKMD
jgi:predicted PurR-regulated permease PerM